VVTKLNEQESILSKAWKLYVVDILKFDDYSELERESITNSKCLKRELQDINVKLKNIEKQSQLRSKPVINIFSRVLKFGYSE
jgi:hypothetical protein